MRLGQLGPLAVVVGAFALIVAAAAAGPSALHVAPAAAIIAVIAVTHTRALSWPSLLAGLLLIVLFIPIRRYSVPLNLPFQLEPYRLFVLVLVSLWGTSLLIDPRVRLRRVGVETRLLVVMGAMTASVIVNAERVTELGVGQEVMKRLTFLVSFVLVVLLVVSVLRTVSQVETPLKILVAGGAMLGLLAIVEVKLDFNPFDHMSKVLPFLNLTDTLDEYATFRAGLSRVVGSAQHPIAFGAALALLAPPALYLALRKRQLRWWLAGVLILIGSVSSLSRTSVIMLATSAVILGILRPETRRLMPLLLPIAIAIQIALPGTLSTMLATFRPAEGLVAEQAAADVGQGRVASLGPALSEFAESPVLGIGYGTRIVTGEGQNSFILDNAWLGVLLDTGVVGVIAWLSLFWWFGTRAGREGRRDSGDRGMLLAALAASVTSYAAGMFFYDAFSFIQVTFIAFVLLGLGSALLADNTRDPEHLPSRDDLERAARDTS